MNESLPLEKLVFRFHMHPYPRQNEVSWSFEENKLFEVALAQVDLRSPNLFESIAIYLPGKTIRQIKDHFLVLVGDIEMIESGSVPIPEYEDIGRRETQVATAERKTYHYKRKKGVPWTAEEHQLFLKGLEKHGKGGWKSVSKFIRSRTPSQVASHAQKYFLRLKKPSFKPKA